MSSYQQTESDCLQGFKKAYKAFYERRATYYKSVKYEGKSSYHSPDACTERERLLYSGWRIAQTTLSCPTVSRNERYAVVQDAKADVLWAKTYCENLVFHKRGVISQMTYEDLRDFLSGKSSIQSHDFSNLAPAEKSMCEVAFDFSKNMAQLEMRQEEQPVNLPVSTFIIPQKYFGLAEDAGDQLNFFCEKWWLKDDLPQEILLDSQPDDICKEMQKIMFYLTKIEKKDSHYTEEDKAIFNSKLCVQVAKVCKLASEYSAFSMRLREKLLKEHRNLIDKIIETADPSKQIGLPYFTAPLSKIFSRETWINIFKGETPKLSEIKEPTVEGSITKEIDPAVMQRLNYPGQLIYRTALSVKDTLQKIDRSLIERAQAEESTVS